MPGTRRRPQAVAGAVPADGGSDDEAPEEIGLSSGKEIAIQQSKQERQVRVAASEERKTRRKAIQQRNLGQKKPKVADDEETREEPRHQGGVTSDDEDGAEEAAEAGPAGADLLPQEVLEALQQQRNGSVAERQARVVSHALQHKAQQGSAQRKRLRLDTVEKGPVTVQVLSAAKRIAAAGRSNFKREQLLGAGAQAQRSFDMLRPPAMARMGPAAKFA